MLPNEVPTVLKINLGKKLRKGETFVTTTKRMTKNRHGQSKMNADLSGPLMTYEVINPGTERVFTKGKRQYLCKVICLVEMKTGLYGWNIYGPDKISKGLRWWQFSYLVKIIET